MVQVAAGAQAGRGGERRGYTKLQINQLKVREIKWMELVLW